MLKTSLMLISVGAAGATYLGARLQSAAIDSPTRKTSNFRVSAGNAHNLSVNVPLGTVTVVAESTKEISVQAIRTTKNPSQNSAKIWMHDSFLTVKNINGVLTVQDHPFGKETLSGVKTGNSNPGKDLGLDIQIHVPNDLAAKLNVSMGNADLRGRFQSISAEISAGTLRSDAVRCSGPMVLNVGAGSIDADLDGASHGSSQLKVGAGEVKLEVPAGADANVSAEVAMGDITGLPESAKKTDGMHLGDRRHGLIGQGDSKVGIHVGTGSIKVQSTGTVIAATVLDEKSSDAEAMMGDEDQDRSQDVDQDGDLSKKIQDAIREATKSADGAHSNFKFDFDQKKDFEKMDKDLAKQLKDIGPMIEGAMKAARPEMDKAMKSVGPEIEKAMREMRPQMEKAMRNVRPEIEKAMKQVKPEIDKAIREAIKEMEKALKELRETEKSHGE